jgi:hypothetical protein
MVAMEWLTAAAKRGMEYLDLHLSAMNISNCVLSVFSFRKLVVIKLKEVHLKVSSSSVHLPSLRILHLNYVYFFEQMNVLNVLNDCPILEDLEAKKVHVFHLTNMYEQLEFIGLTNLIRADIDRWSDYDIPLQAFRNVKFLRLEKV